MFLIVLKNIITWKMGGKITIDSSTLCNKGLEVIEAKWLYDFPIERTKIIMHRESNVHSLLLLKDGSYIADVSKPDMHNPIKWSLFEGKIDYNVEHVKSLKGYKDFHFSKFDPSRYPCVELCLEAYRNGGNATAILNAANEVAVNAFIEGKIPYPAIQREIEVALRNVKYIQNPSLRDLLSTDALTRNYVKSHIERTY